MKKLWVFGDSFSTPFTHYQQYCDFKGYVPKTYYEIVAEKLNLEIKPIGYGGADNFTILEKIIQHIDEVEKNDIVVVGWTDWYRVRIVGENGDWECLNPGHVNQPTVNISNYSIKTIRELILNRDHKKYLEEINYIIKLVKFALRDNLVISWSWIDEDNLLNCDIKHIGRQKTIMEETNKLIWDYHWGEEGHFNLSTPILSYIDKKRNII